MKNNVLVGKDDWLFLWEGGQFQFDYLLGVKTVDAQSITNFSKNIESRVKSFDNKGIVYNHVVFPSKPLVKTKYLPDDLKTKVKSLFNTYYLESLSNVAKGSVYYPLEELKAMENNYSTFLKYDTHMTHRSYFHITKYLLSLIDISIEEYPYSINKFFLGGDLANMLKSPNKNEEELISQDTKNIYRIGNRSFLPSNTNEVYITHSFSSKTNRRLLIFGDSFFKDLIQFLEPFFSDILYIRSSTVEYDIVELYAPDIVFTGNAERYFSNVHSDSESKPFIWNLYGDISYTPSQDYIEAFSANLSFLHHQSIYKEWVERIEEESVYSLKLNKINLYKNLEIVESKQYLKFKSLNNDPYIIYDNIDFKMGKKYIVTMNMISSVDAIFQIFYVDGRKQPFMFTEEKSIKKVISKGLNTLNILLDFAFLGTKLRIDPINTLGEVEIIDIKLDELE